jgi:CRP/FNR family cyclic AMP-dependent transcriptional regulator
LDSARSHPRGTLGLLRSLPLFRDAREQALECVARAARVQSYGRGQVLFRKGDASEELLLVLSGRILVSSVSSEGAEVVLNVIDAGGVIGEIGILDGGERSADAVAMRATRALVLPRREFLALLADEAAVARSMLRLLCARLRQTTAFVEDAVLERLSSRLLHRLQYLSRRYGRPENGGTALRVAHGLSQQALGDSIGASRVSVNKQLNAWRSMGLVRLGRGEIVILDLEKLEAFVHERL